MINFFKKTPKIIEIFSPLDGEILPLSASPDAAFAEGMMGDGICINPSDDTLFAPFDCNIDIFHTLHAVGCNNGSIEAIIHIGMNTVSLKGEGFKALVSLQSNVKKGTPLISFDSKLLKSKVETLITPFIIVSKPNKSSLEILQNSGSVKSGDLIMKIHL